MGKSRKFIDRKTAVTFHLVHRSQQDPLIADESAPQLVLSPASFDKKTKASDVTKRKEEQKKYGIYFDDDYDYLQHLRDANCVTVDWEPAERLSSQAASLKLPSSVFASEVEEDVGLLNRAAPHSGPRLDLDPDVVAAMDEDFNFEDPDNELEDNFVELANAEGGEMGSGGNSYGENDDMSSGKESEDDELGSLCGPQYTFADEETKSHFTNYSMSSSVMRRNEHLTLLDDRFEQMFTNCYGDTDIGALECEEIEGHIATDSKVMIQYAQEMEEECRLNRPLLEPESDSQASHIGRLREEYTDEETEDLVPLELPQDSNERWDCESVMSTYSNLYNRPKIIAEPAMQKRIRISKKTGIPLDILDGINGHGTKLTARVLVRHNAAEDRNHCNDDGTESMVSALSMLSVRPKDETPEERSERKRALRQYRKDRRMERKANTLAFKEEKKRQVKAVLNSKKNIHGIHIL